MKHAYAAFKLHCNPPPKKKKNQTYFLIFFKRFIHIKETDGLIDLILCEKMYVIFTL